MSTPEKLMGHYNSLKEKHEKLDKEIEQAYNTHTDDLVINKMKSEKLHLKEQMYEMEQRLKGNGKTILHGNQ
jgi:uncharacterized protein YdcH (DUF465 family)